MTPNPNGLTGDRYTRVVIPMTDPALWRRSGSAQPAIRCPNADSEPCDYPACNCHQPQAAEAATEIGAEDAPGWLERIADAIDRRTFWLGYAAGLIVAGCGFVAWMLPLINP